MSRGIGPDFGEEDEASEAAAERGSGEVEGVRKCEFFFAQSLGDRVVRLN